MYVILDMGNGQMQLYRGDPDVFAGWRWRPVPRMQVVDSQSGWWVSIEATDGPYGGPEYPAGGPR